MNFVEPIRDLKKISQIKNLLKAPEKSRDLLFFTLGINTALRVSDILQLRVRDLFESSGRVRQFCDIREQKTGKVTRITINRSIREALELYAQNHSRLLESGEHFIFYQRKGVQKGQEAIKRIQAWKLIRSFIENVGLQGNFGTHTLRKTWGYQARKAGVDIAVIQHKLNHSSLAVTRRYLGITADEIEEVCQNLNL